MISTTISLSGFEAFTTFLLLTFPKGGEIWFKFSHNRFFKGVVVNGKITELFHTKGGGEDRKVSQIISNPYQYLRLLSETEDGGIFFIPGKPVGAPIKACAIESDLLSCEMDGGTTEEQWERLNHLSRISGLDWTAIVGSGGKSLHGHISLSAPLPIVTRTHCQRLLAILVLGDPAVTNPHQPMRLPGFFRLEKNRGQNLEYYSNSRYTYNEILEGFKKAFATEGYEFYTEFSDERWAKLRRVIANQKIKDYDPLTPDEQKAKIREILALSEEELNPKWNTPSINFNLNFAGESNGATSHTFHTPTQGSNPPKTINFSYEGDVIPLEYFLPPRWQEYVQTGICAAGEGRQPVGLKIASVLIGTEEILNNLGVKYSGSSYQLLTDYCTRCSPPITDKIDSTYRNAQKGYHRIPVDENEVKAKVFYWQNRNKQISQDVLPELTEDWKKAAHQHWKRHKQFTPTVTQDQQFADFKFPSRDVTLVVKSGLGTGKTHKIADKIHQLPEEQGIIALFATNALALSFCERTGIKHLHRDNAFDELSKPNGRVALCTNSLPHFLDPDWFNGKLLIIDEFMTVTPHLVISSTHKKNRKECMALLTECLRRASSRLLLDGHASDWVIEKYIKRLIGEHPVIKLENLYKPTRPRVEFLIGCEGAKGIKPNDSSALIPAILSSPKLGLICDSQIACEAWEELLKSVGKHGIRVDSKTTADKKHPAQTFLRNPDKWIQEFQPDYVILSPTAQCGIDISIKNYFADVFSLFCGVLTTDAQLQFIARFRDSGIKHHIFCVEYTKKNQEVSSSPFASTVKKAVNEFLLQDIETITKDSKHLFSHLQQIIDDVKDDPHHDAWAILKSQDNYERANLRECLLEGLLEAGYQVKETVLEADKSSQAWLKEAKEQIKLNNCKDIYHAADKTWAEAQEIAANWDATWEERCSVIKASILERLPHIDQHPLWSPDFIYELLYGERQLIRGCELFYLLNNPEDTERHQQNLWAAVALGSGKFLPDIRSRNQIITALLELNIVQFLDPDLDWCNSSPELLELVKQGRRKKIKTALGFSPGVDPIKYLRRCLQLIGIDLSCRYKKRVNGSEAIRFYGINQEKVSNPYRLAVMDAVDRRYSVDAAMAEIRASKWVEISEKFPHLEQPETPTIHSVEPVADQLNFLSELAVSATDSEVVKPNPEPQPEPVTLPKVGQKIKVWDFISETWELKTVKKVVEGRLANVVFSDGCWFWLNALSDQSRFQFA